MKNAMKLSGGLVDLPDNTCGHDAPLLEILAWEALGPASEIPCQADRHFRQKNHRGVIVAVALF
jgi:hypothetical protein